MRLWTGFPVTQRENNSYYNLTVNTVAIASGLIGSGFVTLNYLKGHELLAFVEFVSLIFFAICLLPSNKNRLMLKRNLAIIGVSILMLSVLVDGGVANVGLFWSLIIPFVACLFFGLPNSWYWSLGYAGIVGFIFSLHLLWQPFLPYSFLVLMYFPALYLVFSICAAIFQMQFERLEAKYQVSIAELDHFSQDLEGQVQKRTKALEVKNQELKEEIGKHDETIQALYDSEVQVHQMQKMETIGTLVGGIAHDFNNMLAGINANMFMIKRKVTGDAELLKRTKNVESLVTSASDMVRQLLTFARKDNIEFQHFDLVEHMNESFNLIKVAISEHVQMNLENYAGRLPVYASQTQIQQVIMNMVNNARDATLRLEQPIIQIKVENIQDDDGKDFALISIADNGQGIPEAQQEKIFEPFFTTKEVGKGTGLGLAMSFGAIQSHGGTIKVSSILGKGTDFQIYLPLSDVEEESVFVKTITQDNIVGHETILLVDDDQRLRESQKDVFENIGYTVIEAENGKDAVALFVKKQQEIDLVVMDLTMPVMGGVQASKKMRELSPDVKILFITGYDMQATIDGGHALESGERVLEKPFTMKNLHNAIRDCLLQ